MDEPPPPQPGRAAAIARPAVVAIALVLLAPLVFYAVTGLLIAHRPPTPGAVTETNLPIPDDVFGETDSAATQPAGWRPQRIQAVVAWLRSDADIRGRLTQITVRGDALTADFHSLGRWTRVSVRRSSGTATVFVQEQDWLGKLADLHGGRNFGWRTAWFTDTVAGLLIALSLIGGWLLLRSQPYRWLKLVAILTGVLLVAVAIMVAM
ncbi:MAG: PepSY-associated TM helix domain-containing protein [Phycisphaerae bacterium]|nr:PepSY-associated TM helix domain-containing protein [Phycisphaerae bacterium]